MPGNNLTVNGLAFNAMTANDAVALTGSSLTVLYGSTTDSSLNGNYTLSISANDPNLPALLAALTPYVNQVKALKQIP